MLLASAYVASAQQSTKDIPFNGLIITEEGYAVQKMKVQVKGPATTYTYNLTPGMWEV